MVATELNHLYGKWSPPSNPKQTKSRWRMESIDNGIIGQLNLHLELGWIDPEATQDQLEHLADLKVAAAHNKRLVISTTEATATLEGRHHTIIVPSQAVLSETLYPYDAIEIIRKQLHQRNDDILFHVNKSSYHTSMLSGGAIPHCMSKIPAGEVLFLVDGPHSSSEYPGLVTSFNGDRGWFSGTHHCKEHRQALSDQSDGILTPIPVCHAGFSLLILSAIATHGKSRWREALPKAITSAACMFIGQPYDRSLGHLPYGTISSQRIFFGANYSKTDLESGYLILA